MADRKLTTRQENLYKALVASNESDPERWLTQQEVADAVNPTLKNPKRGYFINLGAKAHNKCASIWADCEAINNTMFKDKIIITDHMAYKIANSTKEARKYVEGMKTRLARISRRVSLLERKIWQADQGKTTTNNGTAFKEGKTLPFHDTFPNVRIAKKEDEK